MKQSHLSFKIKLRIVILSVSIISLVLALVSIGFFNVKKNQQQLLDNIEILSKSTIYNVKPTLTFNDSISAKKILNSLNVSQDILTATLFDDLGNTFAQYQALSLLESLPAIDNTKKGYFFKEYLDYNYIEFYQPIKVNKKQIGLLVIQASQEKISAALKEYLLISCAIIIVALPIILVLSEFLQRMITRPIMTLSQAIHDIQKQANYSARVKVSSKDEIGDLIIDFNKMLSILESRDQQLIDYQVTLEQRIEERTQDLLVAKEIAEKANLAKSDFLSSMSHELRTPMNSILGFSQLVEMDELTPQHKEANDAILKAGYHLLDLIDKILDLSKIESGHLELNKDVCSLHIILVDCINLIKPLADKRGISIICHFDEYNDVELEVDLIRLNQVIINLLSNAVKYNRLAGTITLENEKLEDKVRITVTDTGKGLLKEQMGKVFQPFERLDAVNSAIEGTGVGLTICKKIITAMNGDIGVYSTIGQGTSFWIEIPIK